jgi:hypothetical protein
MVSLITIVRNSKSRIHLRTHEQPGLTATATEFLEAIRSVNPPSRWKILVVDDHSQKLIGSVLKQNDILQESVTSM